MATQNIWCKNQNSKYTFCLSSKVSLYQNDWICMLLYIGVHKQENQANLHPPPPSHYYHYYILHWEPCWTIHESYSEGSTTMHTNTIAGPI